VRELVPSAADREGGGKRRGISIWRPIVMKKRKKGGKKGTNSKREAMTFLFDAKQKKGRKCKKESPAAPLPPISRQT